MTDTKIQGKFYPLQNEEWVRCCQELTKSQLSVLYYLRSLDPYSNGVKVKASAVAEKLGITKRAVNSAIATLEEKGYISLEDIEYSAKISAGGCLCDTYSTVTEVGTEFPTQEQNFPLENRISHPRTEFLTQEQDFSPKNTISHQKPETLTQEEPQSSKTIKTYSDFIQTLSEEERASFLDFCREKTKNFSKEVNDIEAWLAHTTKAGQNRWDVYYKKYTSGQQKQTNKSKSSANSQVMKKFTLEIEQRYQQAQANWQKSQASSVEQEVQRD